MKLFETRPVFTYIGRTELSLTRVGAEIYIAPQTGSEWPKFGPLGAHKQKVYIYPGAVLAGM